jgi:hypothetical protein
MLILKRPVPEQPLLEAYLLVLAYRPLLEAYLLVLVPLE